MIKILYYILFSFIFIIYHNYSFAETDIDLTVKQANEGNPLAQYQLAVRYHEGIGVKKDLQKSSYWMEKAAENNHAMAQMIMGGNYLRGKDGVKKDIDKGAKYLHKSAEQGLSDAICLLGIMYLDAGEIKSGCELLKTAFIKRLNQDDMGIPLNRIIKEYDDRCYDLNSDANFDLDQLEKMAEKGSSVAQFKLGFINYTGKNIKKDDKKAALWLEKAATQGDVRAQSMIGFQYMSGQGVIKDLNKSFYWYNKASENGDKDALLFIGGMYLTGRGVKKDKSKGCNIVKNFLDIGNELANKLYNDYCR